MKRLISICTLFLVYISLFSSISLAQNTSCRVYGLSEDNSVVVTVNTPFVKSKPGAGITSPYIVVKLSLSKSVSSEVGISVKVYKDKSNVANETIYIPAGKKEITKNIEVDAPEQFYNVRISYASCSD